MEKKKKLIKNLIIFILLIGLTFYILLKDKNLDDIFTILFNVKKSYICIAIVCMCAYILCEAINMKRNLGVLNEKVSIIKTIKYTLINFFFSAITPSSTGGQPMEIYYMYKENIKGSNSTLAILMQLCSFQIITNAFAIISIFFTNKYLTRTLMWLFILGVIINSAALIVLLIAIFSKRLSNALIKFAVNVLKFFKVKNIEEKRDKLEQGLISYQDSAKYIKTHKKVMLLTLFTTCAQIIFYYSIPYWIYRAFGLQALNIFQIIAIQATLYTISAGLPLPGAVGVSEGSFIAIFEKVFESENINSAMLLSRGVSFYLFVIISGIVVISNIIKYKEKKLEE